MPIQPDPSSFRAWLACVVFLFLKMFGNTLVQGLAKHRDRVASLPEDAKAFGLRAAMESESDLYERGAGCWENDLENIPMFLLLGLGFVLAGGEPVWCATIFATFSVSRLLHTIFYVQALQPHRAIAYFIGVGASFALAGGIAMRLLPG